MIAFEVNDMTCGHCVSTIAKALRTVDPQAAVHIDLARHRVEVDATETDSQALSDAIEEAGYTPLAVGIAPVTTAVQAGGGCCCG